VKTFLLNATKKRIIRELRKILYDHPRYRADSQNVTNKYSFKERPQRGIIINGTSADRVRLSADNYIGRLSSFCMLTWVHAHQGTSIEWVRENFPALEEISRKRDIFPSQPGVYVVDVRAVPDDARSVPGQFFIQPLLSVVNEPLIVFSTSADQTAQISRTDIYPGSVRLWLDGRTGLVQGTDFTVNYETGEVEFHKSTPTGGMIFADYRYKLPEQGPLYFQREEFNSTAIPGCVIAFGDRCQACDKQAIVVTDERTDVADVYGGKYEVNLSVVVFTRDAEDREKMTDYVLMKILELQNSLATEGIELLDVSPGGEDEEVYNQDSDEYYYETTISLSVRVDWETYVSLPITIIRDSFSSAEAEQEFGNLDGSIPQDLLKPTSSYVDINTVPIVIGRTIYYERIT
jgi:hypothetical protein